MSAGVPKNIDEYIALFAPEIGQILRDIRALAREIAPNAIETISYQIPCFKDNKRIFYFAAFKSHIGIYPPIPKDSPSFEKLKPFMNEKCNLRFQYKDTIPMKLIAQIIEEKLGSGLIKKSAKAVKMAK